MRDAFEDAWQSIGGAQDAGLDEKDVVAGDSRDLALWLSISDSRQPAWMLDLGENVVE